jgi:putative ABC transport system permease protein
MHSFLQDVRFAIRTLAKSPGFTAVVVLTLAIGIGANTAIFSFVDGVLLKPLPFPDPEQIVVLWEKPPGGDRNVVSAMNFLDWKNQSTSFRGLAAMGGGGHTLTGIGEPVQLRGTRVSASYFDVFGIRSALGRTFARDEDEPGKERVVVLSNRLWQSRFGSDKGIIGRTIGLSGIPHVVIGVLPADSSADRGFADIWIPLAFQPDERTRDFHWLRVVGRLKPGVSIEQARAEMRGIGDRIAKDFPVSNKGWNVTVDLFAERMVAPQLRQSLYVLMAAVGAVLLIGCANIANLLLARSTGRERELAIRSSIGAGRGRLIQQFLTESLVLSLFGAMLGLAIGYGLIAGLTALMPPFSLPSEVLVQMDLRVLAFTLALAVITAVVFGTAPALQATRADLANSLKEAGRGSSGTGARKRLRSALVVVEIALSFVLLTGAGLLIRSFFALQNVNAGFDSTNVVTMGLPVAKTRFADAEQLIAYQTHVVNELEALPGVRSVALTTALPLQGWGYGMPFLIAGRQVVDRANRDACFFKMVTASYFSTLGVQLRKGRTLSDLDRRGGAPVTVINETMANRYFKDEEPVGKRILVQEIVPGRPELGPEIPWEVVGVIADEKVGGLDDNRSSGMYVPLLQSPNFYTSIVVRADMDPTRLVKAMEQRVHQIDKNQALTDIKTMDRIKSESVASNRLRTMLLGVFAGIALLLAGVGIYGVVSYSVAQRSHELGIRSALGATSGSLVRLVISNGMLMAVAGLVIGGAGAFAITRTLSTLLFNVSPNDPATLLSVAALLAGIALLACYVPARRVTAIDPIEALRYE